jgi:hypothetical protein
MSQVTLTFGITCGIIGGILAVVLYLLVDHILITRQIKSHGVQKNHTDREAAGHNQGHP